MKICETIYGSDLTKDRKRTLYTHSHFHSSTHLGFSSPPRTRVSAEAGVETFLRLHIRWFLNFSHLATPRSMLVMRYDIRCMESLARPRVRMASNPRIISAKLRWATCCETKEGHSHGNIINVVIPRRVSTSPGSTTRLNITLRSSIASCSKDRWISSISVGTSWKSSTGAWMHASRRSGGWLGYLPEESWKTATEQAKAR